MGTEKEKRQNFSFNLRPSVRKKLTEYADKHGLVIGVLIERLILAKIKEDEK